MSDELIIGLHRNDNDAFWVQVEEAIYQAAKAFPIQLVPITSSVIDAAQDRNAQFTVVDELLALEAHALIGWYWPEKLAIPVLDAGLPIIHLSETEVIHPLSVSPRGLFDVARLAADYVAGQLNGHGSVLVVGGLLLPFLQDDGRSRLAGIKASFAACPGINYEHIPTVWSDAAYSQIHAAMQDMTARLDGLIGLSDSLTLMARNAASDLGLVDAKTVIVGINGDPLALSAITRGEIAATVETDPCVLAARAVELAVRAARCEPLPAYYPFEYRLVTAQNVASVAAKRLLATATLPSRFIENIRRIEQQHQVQVETSLTISHRVGSLLDSHALAQEIADVIRTQYGYDRAFLYRWDEAERTLVLEGSPVTVEQAPIIPQDRGDILVRAFLSNEALSIPDTRRSLRFSADPLWPDTRSRVVLPIRLGGIAVGLLDLHSTHSSLRPGQCQLVELRTLADQLGIAMHNARRYQSERKLREVAEEDAKIKSRLFVNLGQELRAPLLDIRHNAALLEQNRVLSESHSEYVLGRIRSNTDYMLQVVDGLLNLSQAYLGEYSLTTEMADVRPILLQIIEEELDRDELSSWSHLHWEIPERLPLFMIDPIRLQQALHYLFEHVRTISVEHKIVICAFIESPWLHILVRDIVSSESQSGQCDIVNDVTSQQAAHIWRHGLELEIVRRVVMLHGGKLTSHGEPGCDRMIQVSLPLPTLLDRAAESETRRPGDVILVVGASADQTNLPEGCSPPSTHLRCARACSELEQALREVEPSALVYDASSASSGDWALLLAIRRNPRLHRLPFLLYMAPVEAECELVLGKTLTATIANLCPDVTGKTILVVDGEQDQGNEYQVLFERHLPGLPIRITHTGADAEMELHLAPPALVLLEPWLPDMDGFDLLDMLRADNRLRQIPVLLITAQTLPAAHLARLSDTGQVILCGKDILSPEEMAELLQRVLAGRDLLPAQTSYLVKQAIVYLQCHFANAISRSDVAGAVGISESYLSQIFRQEIGISLWEYLTRYRIRQAKQLLRRTTHSITEVASAVGIQDSAYFSRIFHKLLGMSPSAYRVAFQKNSIA
ncbi:MAG: helix-turn-helix domain-containing protein [Caldilinea sp.]